MTPPSAELERARAATLFAALGDATRLSLLARLQNGEPRSIAELTHGLDQSRQGVTKHLRILEQADMVASRRFGRRSLFVIDPAGLGAARHYLERASRQWDDAIGRLTAFVESSEQVEDER